jgi:hypothetical protein
VVACLVALLIGVVGLVQLGSLEQRTREIEPDALIPSTQIAEVRRAFLQTRIDPLADELLPRTGTQDTAHEAYLADVDAMGAVIETYNRERPHRGAAAGRHRAARRLAAVLGARGRPLPAGRT